MKWFVLCVLLCVPAMAQETVQVPFENLNIFEPFPDYVYAMPRPFFEKWAKMQNDGAYAQAERLSDIFKQRNPYRETYVQTNAYKAQVQQHQAETVSENSASMTGTQKTDYDGKNVQSYYRQESYGGGPVVIINPYCDRPAKVIIKDDGTVYVADPDKTLKPGQAEKLIEK
jgi:hypothetical protein